MRELLKYPTVKPSPFYQKLTNYYIRCISCERRCIIPINGTGVCKTKTNINGKLYTLTYGDLSSVESRPIEIKPFYNFWPGSTAITISTWSCNFPCPWCQNWHISKYPPKPEKAVYTPPERVIRIAELNKDQGTCVSFNEPTMLLEYSIDLFKQARERGLYNTYVSNGYMTIHALDELIKAGLNGLKIDIKGDKEVYRRILAANHEIPWRNAEYAQKHGVHVEIVALLVTGICDKEEVIDDIIETHLKKLGPDTPLHFTRYYPAYKYHKPPTKIEILEKAYLKAKKRGINYVYTGNIPGHPYEHTYCPNCGKPVIKRYNYYIIEINLTKDKKCKYCGQSIKITGELPNRL